MFKLLIPVFLFVVASAGFSELHYYCVFRMNDFLKREHYKDHKIEVKNKSDKEFFSNNTQVKGFYLKVNESLDLKPYSDYLYTITQSDIDGGKFSSLFGFGTPYAFFISPQINEKDKALSDKIKTEEMNYLLWQIPRLCNLAISREGYRNYNIIWKELRVVDDTDKIAWNTGKTYPAVYLRLSKPEDKNKQNIFRIDRFSAGKSAKPR